MGVVMGMVSTSTVAKDRCRWLPITIFFAHGYEQCGREHVPDPRRHAAGRQDDDRTVVDVEPDPGDARHLAGGFFSPPWRFNLTYRVRAATIRSGEPAAQTAT